MQRRSVVRIHSRRQPREEQVEPELTVDEIDQALGYANAPPITSPAYVDKLLDQRNATTN